VSFRQVRRRLALVLSPAALIIGLAILAALRLA
jgi:hypothetical protein